MTDSLTYLHSESRSLQWRLSTLSTEPSLSSPSALMYAMYADTDLRHTPLLDDAAFSAALSQEHSSGLEEIKDDRLDLYSGEREREVNTLSVPPVFFIVNSLFPSLEAPCYSLSLSDLPLTLSLPHSLPHF